MTTTVERMARKREIRLRQGTLPHAGVVAHYDVDPLRRAWGTGYVHGYHEGLAESDVDIAKAESRTRLRTIALVEDATRRSTAEEIARLLDDLDRTGEWGDVIRARYRLAPRWRS